MLVVSDIDDVFLPKPTDLLVNLTESRPALEALLGRLSDMFQDNHTIGSALGPALQAGYKLMVRSRTVAKFPQPYMSVRPTLEARSLSSLLLFLLLVREH